MDASALRKGPRRAAQTAVVNWIAGSNCCDATAIVCDSIVTTRLALGMTVCLMTQPPSVLCRYRNGGSHDGVDAPIAAIKLITSVCAARFLTPIFVHDYAFAIAPSQSKFCIQYLFAHSIVQRLRHLDQTCPATSHPAQCFRVGL